MQKLSTVKTENDLGLLLISSGYNHRKKVIHSLKGNFARGKMANDLSL